MSERQTITIQRDYDVILARSRVRDLARRIGLRTTDQARISLATSSAARAMGLGSPYQGQIVIELLGDRDTVGMRVICSVPEGTNNGTLPRTFGDAQLMADELTVKRVPSSNELRVTLVKWAK